MKDYELLDLIGQVDEDYVLAAGDNVVRPRSRWKAFVACAACAALVLAAWPMAAMEADQKDAAPEAPGLHAYIVMEGASGAQERSEAAPKAPAEGAAPDYAADRDGPVLGAAVPGDGGEMGKENAAGGGDGERYWSGERPVQEAALWYNTLLHSMRLEDCPQWYGGAWIAGDRLLAVAVVDGFRTPELETQLQEAAGEGAVLRLSTVKYSMEFLNGLMEPAGQALEGTGLSCGIGVDVAANCLGVDLYGGSGSVPEGVLARLAHLDPDGDAIRVRVFPGTLSNADEAVKGPGGDVPLATPAPPDQRKGPAEECVPAVTTDDAKVYHKEDAPTVNGVKVYHGEDAPADAVPGGAYVGGLPKAGEGGR
ncbi:MAG: hypothetical protein HFG47_08290 [Lachnospiraceae bacterium]|nr:hypothetical protein [Oscillospiraceae bacterium]MCI9103292.1 hypothetical protein [Lachnospiraceae bacterium]